MTTAGYSRRLRIAQRRRTPGFTIVELLVVISLIALLIALLLPALGKARRASKRSLCANNLRQFGIGISSWAVDNDARVMTQARDRDAVRWPTYINARTITTTARNTFSADKINEYTGDVINLRGEVDGIAICPFQDRDVIARWNVESNWPLLPNLIVFGYSYFGRVDTMAPATGATLTAHNSAADDLVANTLTGARIIMADDLARGDRGKAWWYNHGTNPNTDTGWSFWNSWLIEIDAGRGDRGLAPKITGLNRLWGDGSARWLDRQDFEGISDMRDAEWTGGFLSHAGDDDQRFYYGSKVNPAAGNN